MNIVFNKKEDTTEIEILGDIGENFFSEGNTLSSVKAQFKGVTTPKTTITVATFGGSVDAGFQIHDFVKSLDSEVTVKIVGWTASMGTIIALAADKVEMSENAFFLIHNAWNGVIGNAKQLKEEAELLESVDNRLVAVYTDKTGLPPEDIRELMEEEKWISAEEAKELGFIDKVNDPIKAAASISNKELTKAGLPTLPENITNKLKEMQETTKVEETAEVVATTEVSKLTEALTSFKDTIVNFTEKFSNKPEEVKILDNEEVANKLTSLETELATAADRQTEIDTLNAKVSDLEAKLSAANAGETVLSTTDEPAIDGTETVEPNAEWINSFKNGTWRSRK